jgi:hypothetical protein
MDKLLAGLRNALGLELGIALVVYVLYHLLHR